MAVQVIGWTVGAIIIGALLYPLLMMARERKWCRFVGISPHEYKEVRHLLPLPVRNSPYLPLPCLLPVACLSRPRSSLISFVIDCRTGTFAAYRFV